MHSRMLKNALNFILSRPKFSHTPEGTLRASPSLRPRSGRGPSWRAWGGRMPWEQSRSWPARGGRVPWSAFWSIPMELRFSFMLLVLISFLSGCVTINIPPGPGPVKEETITGKGADKVLLLDLSGLISSQESEGFVSRPSMVANVKEELIRAANDPHVKAVVVRINSPGGTVTASDIIYHELRAFRQKRQVPVIASIMDVGASGGYYVAAAADKIIVHPSSITGSLGVIMLTINARGLLEKVGLQANAITSGPKKDMGSPFKAMSDEERAIFQGLINSFYDRFLAVIHEGRPHLSSDDVRKLADGRVYSGEQATALGLVDRIGYLEDAIEMAKQEAKLTDARVVAYRRPGEYKNNIYSRLAGSGDAGGLMGLLSLDLPAVVRGGTPQFMYLWMP